MSDKLDMWLFGSGGRMSHAEIVTPTYRYCRRCRRWYDDQGNSSPDAPRHISFQYHDKVCANKQCATPAPEATETEP